jgi:hypothetical protein
MIKMTIRGAGVRRHRKAFCKKHKPRLCQIIEWTGLAADRKAKEKLIYEAECPHMQGG